VSSFIIGVLFATNTRIFYMFIREFATYYIGLTSIQKGFLDLLPWMTEMQRWRGYHPPLRDLPLGKGLLTGMALRKPPKTGRSFWGRGSTMLGRRSSVRWQERFQYC